MWPTNIMSSNLALVRRELITTVTVCIWIISKHTVIRTTRNSVHTRKHAQTPSALVDSPQSVVSQSTAPTDPQYQQLHYYYYATACDLIGRLFATGCSARLRCCRPQVFSPSCWSNTPTGVTSQRLTPTATATIIANASICHCSFLQKFWNSVL